MTTAAPVRTAGTIARACEALEEQRAAKRAELAGIPAAREAARQRGLEAEIASLDSQIVTARAEENRLRAIEHRAQLQSQYPAAVAAVEAAIAKFEQSFAAPARAARDLRGPLERLAAIVGPLEGRSVEQVVNGQLPGPRQFLAQATRRLADWALYLGPPPERVALGDAQGRAERLLYDTFFGPNGK